MYTAASLKSRTLKDLGQMAKKIGVPGWHSMRKEQLVRALVSAAESHAKPQRKSASGSSSKRSKSTRALQKAAPSRRAKTAAAASRRPAKPAASKSTRSTSRKALSSKAPASKAPASKAPASNVPASKAPVAKRKSPKLIRRLELIRAERGRRKDISTERAPDENGKTNGRQVKDRIVLLVRDPYWLQACWDLTRNSVRRAEAAMAEHWHTAHPVLRLIEVEAGAMTTSTAETVVRDIEIHGGVNNWYIDVQNPPSSYRVEIGYLAANGKFYSLVRSNTVTTPAPASSDALDEHWSDIAENYEKIYAQSGGGLDEEGPSELRDLFEERLRRPMSTPVVAKYGIGADRMLNRNHDFHFEVDAEVIIYGCTKPNARVSIAGEPVKLRPDGTFTVRHSLPDRRQVLPIVAGSSDGHEQRTIVLAIERNTKVMEPVVREANE